MEFLDLPAVLKGESGAAEADGIDSGDAVVSDADQKGRDVLTESGGALDHAVVSDPNELMENGSAAEEATIPDGDMSAHQAIVGQNIAVAEKDVVTEMDSSHEEVIVPNCGGFGLGAAVDGDKLADVISESDPDASGFGGIPGKILRRRPEDGRGSDGCFRTDLDRSLEKGVGTDLAAGVQGNRTFDDGIGTNDDSRGQSGFRRNESGGMNGHSRVTRAEQWLIVGPIRES